MTALRSHQWLVLLIVTAFTVFAAGCEGVRVVTPTPDASASATPELRESTAAPTERPEPTEAPNATTQTAATVVERTPVSGGRPVPSVTVTSVSPSRLTPTPVRPIVTSLRPVPTPTVRPLPTLPTLPGQPTVGSSPSPVSTATAARTATSTATATSTSVSVVRPTPAATVSDGFQRQSSELSDLGVYEGAQVLGIEDVLIGVLLTSDMSFDSICNGGSFDTYSIFNDASPYGGPFGANSPFNVDSTAPPRVVVDGVEVGHLSVSPFVSDPIDPYAMLEWLGCPVP